MNNQKIAVCSRTFSKHPQLRDEVRKLFPNAYFNDEGKKLGGDELVHFLKESDGAIVALEKITDGVLEKLPNLKVISKYGVGLDNIDFEAIRKHQKILGWKGGLNKRSVSELTLGLALDLLRKITLQNNNVKGGSWANLKGRQLSDKTFGIIGLGHIGKDLVSLLSPFGCRILVNDIVDVDEYCLNHNLKHVTKDELYKESDIISLHVPLTSETKHLIAKKELEKMKNTGILINTSRGQVVQEQDLYQALKGNKLAGAALDVFEEEPPLESPLLSLENFLATPHCGGSSQEGVLAMGRGAIHHLVQYFQ